MKNRIQLTDIGLIIIATVVLIGFAYKILTSDNLSASLRLTAFLSATILFGLKGFELNKLIRKIQNQKAQNFFDYYEYELDQMMKTMKPNVKLFLPIKLKVENKEIRKMAYRINLITYSMYILLALAIVI